MLLSQADDPPCCAVVFALEKSELVVVARDGVERARVMRVECEHLEAGKVCTRNTAYTPVVAAVGALVDG